MLQTGAQQLVWTIFWCLQIPWVCRGIHLTSRAKEQGRCHDGRGSCGTCKRDPPDWNTWRTLHIKITNLIWEYQLMAEVCKITSFPSYHQHFTFFFHKIVKKQTARQSCWPRVYEPIRAPENLESRSLWKKRKALQWGLWGLVPQHKHSDHQLSFSWVSLHSGTFGNWFVIFWILQVSWRTWL